MERAIPILPSHDLAVAKAFYVDGLGFRVTFEASADGRTGLLGLQRGTIELTLDCPMEGHGRNACVSLHVTDTDAYYREWSAKVTPLRPPKNEEWGARTFDLLDPSGNTLFVIGPQCRTDKGSSMSDTDRSRVMHLSETRARIPGPAGEHAVRVFERGTLDVALSIPRAPIPQTPHAQDEVYIVVRGKGFLLHDGKRDPFGAGDLLFVAAGIEHQFEDLSDDFAVWRIFYGRQGGESPVAEGM